MRVRGVVAVLGLCVLTFVAARRWLRVVVVDGPSMAPTYSDGDRLLALYAGRSLRVARGDVVVVRAPDPHWTAEHPLDQAHVTLVKRVVAVPGDVRPDNAERVPSGTVYVEGDAPGYDSTAFGPLPRSEVLGRVLLKLTGAAHADGSAT